MLMISGHGLASKKSKSELRAINKEIAGVREKLAAFEARKVTLERDLRERLEPRLFAHAPSGLSSPKTFPAYADAIPDRFDRPENNSSHNRLRNSAISWRCGGH
ncbi:MAG: hypothetical protein ACT4O2_06760 [Beijerinckiaceae bacterium]